MFFLWTVYSNFVIKCSFLFDIGKTCHLNVKVSIMYVRLSQKYNLIRTKISCPVYNLKNCSLFSRYKYCSFIFKYLFLILKFRKRGVLTTNLVEGKYSLIDLSLANQIDWTHHITQLTEHNQHNSFYVFHSNNVGTICLPFQPKL